MKITIDQENKEVSLEGEATVKAVIQLLKDRLSADEVSKFKFIAHQKIQSIYNNYPLTSYPNTPFYAYKEDTTN